MVFKAQIRSFGNSSGLILTKEMCAHLNVSIGDSIYLSPNQDGVQVTPYDPEFEAAMEAYERGKKQYRNALRELAKR